MNSASQRMSLKQMEAFRAGLLQNLQKRKAHPEAPYSEKKKEGIRRIVNQLGGGLAIEVPRGLEKATQAYAASPRTDADWTRVLRLRLMLESKGEFYLLPAEGQKQKLEAAFQDGELHNQRFHIDDAAAAGREIVVKMEGPSDAAYLFEIDEAIAAKKKRFSLEGVPFKRRPESGPAADQPGQRLDRERDASRN